MVGRRSGEESALKIMKGLFTLHALYSKILIRPKPLHKTFWPEVTLIKAFNYPEVKIQDFTLQKGMNMTQSNKENTGSPPIYQRGTFHQKFSRKLQIPY